MTFTDIGIMLDLFEINLKVFILNHKFISGIIISFLILLFVWIINNMPRNK